MASTKSSATAEEGVNGQQWSVVCEMGHCGMREKAVENEEWEEVTFARKRQQQPFSSQPKNSVITGTPSFEGLIFLFAFHSSGRKQVSETFQL